MRIILVIILFICFGFATPKTFIHITKSDTGIAGLIIPPPVIFVYAGESNSGGYGQNDSLSSDEAAARSLIIYNNSSLVLENLDIGTNNLIAHTGLPANATHGWENQHANRFSNGSFGSRYVAIVKAGQGGSRAQAWTPGGTYAGVNCFDTLKTRVNAAKAIVTSNVGVPNIVLFWSQGINDILSSYAPASWKAETKQIFQEFQAEWPGITIYMTRFNSMSTNLAYETAMAEIESEMTGVYAVSTLGATLRDSNHWGYSGLKVVSDSLINRFLNQ